MIEMIINVCSCELLDNLDHAYEFLVLADTARSQLEEKWPFPLKWGCLGTCARDDNSLSANNTGYLCRQFRQRGLYCIPNHVEIDVEVTMGDAVAHSAHASPRYF